MPKKKVNVRKDYSYEAKKSLPKYAQASVARKTLYMILRGPGLEPREFLAENEAMKAFAIKARIKLKFVQAKTEAELIQAMKDANVWAAGIVANLGSLDDDSGNIKKTIKKILISTVEVREDGSYVDSLKRLFENP